MRVNRTSRSGGAVGGKALVPRLVRKLVSKNKTILDFGAGKKAIHTKRIRRSGYNVSAWDIGDNFNPKIHDAAALKRRYNVVLASNVLNVQPSRQKLKETITQIVSLIANRGMAIINFPENPRHNIVTDKGVYLLLKKYGRVEKMPSNIYILHKKR